MITLEFAIDGVDAIDHAIITLGHLRTCYDPDATSADFADDATPAGATARMLPDLGERILAGRVASAIVGPAAPAA